MTTYTDVFSGSLIQPAEISYAAVTLTATTSFSWPLETSAETDLIAKVMDVTATLPDLAIVMPDAQAAGVGESVLFTNRGAETYVVKDNDGFDIVSLAPGEAWQIYLTDNSTAPGTWNTYQFGAFLSSANAAALAGTGLIAIANMLAQDMPANTFNTDYVSGTPDRAQLFVWTGAAGAFTLPDPVTVGNGWYVQVKNAGSGNLTMTSAGAALIDNDASKVFSINDSAIVVSDGVGYYTLGFGQLVEFAFDNVSINVAGTGNYTLSGNELNRVSYNFTGVLTGNRSIIVPATIQQYWVRNSTTGSFTLTVKVLGQPGVDVTQGGASILYCDGVDVVNANTGGIAVPIGVSQGGTGAATASAARVNLGSGSVGDAVFISATTAAAYAALGLPPLGVIDGGTF